MVNEVCKKRALGMRAANLLQFWRKAHKLIHAAFRGSLGKVYKGLGRLQTDSVTNSTLLLRQLRPALEIAQGRVDDRPDRHF